MSLSAIENLTSMPNSAVTSRPKAHAFAERLAEVRLADAPSVPELDPEQAEELRTAAQQLVATTLIQPMLAKMREDPFKSDLFHGGRAEEIFGQQLDVIYSERIVSRADFSVVDAVYNNMAQRAAQAASRGGGVNLHA